MKSKDLVSIADLRPEDVAGLIVSATELKRGTRRPRLEGKSLALLFEKPSLRTRVSFDIAMQQMGGHALYLSPQEVGLGAREPVADVARVLSRFVNGMVARTFSHQTVVLLAQHASVPVINGLSDYEHPCQALADLLTIYEKKGRLEGLTLAYVGDANNVANSLMLAAAQVGLNFNIASPAGYELDPRVLRLAQGYAQASGASIACTQKPAEAVAGADAVYTDVWTSMGQESEAEKRRKAFAGYQVNAALLARAKKDAILMHPLPAHPGEELAPGMTDCAQSVVFDQAENRLHIQKAILVELLSGR